MRTYKESDLLKDFRYALDILSNRGELSYRRLHVMPVLRGGKYSRNRDQAGMEDVQIYLKGGVTLFCELKAAGGRQSESQKQRQKELEALGHHYRVYRSIEELFKVLESYGVTLWAKPRKTSGIIKGDKHGKHIRNRAIKKDRRGSSRGYECC